MSRKECVVWPPLLAAASGLIAAGERWTLPAEGRTAEAGDPISRDCGWLDRLARRLARPSGVTSPVIP